LGSYNAEQYQLLRDLLEAVPFKDGDEWLEHLLKQDRMLGEQGSNLKRQLASIPAAAAGDPLAMVNPAVKLLKPVTWELPCRCTCGSMPRTKTRQQCRSSRRTPVLMRSTCHSATHVCLLVAVTHTAVAVSKHSGVTLCPPPPSPPLILFHASVAGSSMNAFLGEQRCASWMCVTPMPVKTLSGTSSSA
jgi:hypothetical protein